MLLARLNCLPDTSALSASVLDVPRGWGVDRHVAVTTIDALQQNTYATVKVAGGRTRKPKAMDRPKASRKRRVVVSIADILRAESDNREG